MKLLYSFSILLYNTLVRVASTWNEKAKKWIEGRKQVFIDLEKRVEHNKPVCWIHCASVGEFEQARPIIEKIHKQQDYFILLTFFSPSGIELRKEYDKADYVSYIPADTISNSKKFLDIVKPQIAVFIKYEFWFNYLSELNKRKVDTFLISGIFRPSQHFFKPYGIWFKKQLEAFNHFFIQNQESQDLLNSIGYANNTVTGDTRFDRVYEISKEKYNNTILEYFCETEKTIIAGSTWGEEHKLILNFVNNVTNTCKFIIAPHQIHKDEIDKLKNEIGNTSILFSQCNSVDDLNGKRIIIIDSVGLLSKLYRFADLTIIGGGFGSGIHNTLEPATYGKPILFGPNYSKFQEAKDLIKKDAAICFNNYEELERNLNMLLSDDSKRISFGQNSLEYVKSNLGATEKIYDQIFK